MPAHRLDITGHLTSKEIYGRYRSCKHVVEREHWHILWLMTRESYQCSAEEAAMILGRTPQSVRSIIRRYNKEGPDGLQDGRKGRSGRKSVLTRRQQRQLFQELRGEPPDGGLWTGPKVASWVEQHARVRVSKVTGWQYLRLLGFSLQVPRPQHTAAATPAEQTIWKKNFK